MPSTRIDQIGKSHLRNAAKSLKIRVFYEIENKFIGNMNKPIYRVIYYFKFVA